MDIYEQSLAYFISLPSVDLWEEMQSLFRRAASGKPRHWLLPARTCEAVGGDPDQSIPVIAALACSHIGILLVDDMLDSDPRGEYQRIGAPATGNLACAFQSAALEAIANCGNSPDVRLAALTSVNEMFLSTALGQTWDIEAAAEEAAYWRVVRTKSSPFFGTAFQIGALIGGAPIGKAKQLRQLGNLYGEMIQIHDDMNDSMSIPASPDWIQGRSPLPILFARQVDHSERARFQELCGVIREPGVLQEAQQILIRCGAISFCVDQLLRRHQSACAMLDALTLKRRESLDALFEEAIAPVWKLFERLGETLFDTSTAREWLSPLG